MLKGSATDVGRIIITGTDDLPLADKSDSSGREGCHLPAQSYLSAKKYFQRSPDTVAVHNTIFQAFQVFRE